MALMKETNRYKDLLDSHSRDNNGMPDCNGTAVLMRFLNIFEYSSI